MKRIFVAIIFGLLAGVLCASMSFYAGILKYSVVVLIWVLLNRVVMGFAIGASGLRLHWAWNGIAIGMATGSIFSYFLFMNGAAEPLPVINFFANGVFGLGIEFFTTVVFKQRSASAPTRTLNALSRVASA